MKLPASKLRLLLWFGGGVVLLVLLLTVGVFLLGQPFLAKQVASEPFRLMLSKQVSKALKVDGEFAPLKLEGWTAVTEGYTSTGWPGEAIGGLDATNVRGTFRPSGIFSGLWSVDPILIEKGKFSLRTPNDALKKPPAPPGKRPWYANLMPQQFHAGWIDCASADVEFPFANTSGGLRGVHLGATMVGKDFKYYVKGGELVFPKLPTLALDAAQIYVTREMVQIDYTYLRDPSGGPARLNLSGRMGMREDKSVDVKADFAALGISPLLPDAVQDSVTGTATGQLSYTSDKTGHNANGAGNLKLSGASLSNWGPLDDLARLHHNPSLRSFEFDEASLSYSLVQDRFRVENLQLSVKDKIHLAGKLEYDIATNNASLDLSVAQMPIKTWLPTDLKGLTDAEIRGHLVWAGSVKDWENSTASGLLDFSGASIQTPVSGIGTLGKASVRFPENTTLKQAVIEFNYEKQTFRATRLEFEDPEFFRISGSAEWDPQDELHADVTFEFLKLAAWLPRTLSNKISGNLSGVLRWKCPGFKLEKGSGAGSLKLNGAVLRDFEFEKFLARFLKSDEWLTMRLTEASLNWKREGEVIEVTDINLFAKGKVGLRGSLRISSEGEVSGTLYAGTTEAALVWLPDARKTVFSKADDGLLWAKLKVHGTVEKPKTDLPQQVMTQLKKHPFALAELAMRGLSWWLGDVLGTAPKER